MLAANGPPLEVASQRAEECGARWAGAAGSGGGRVRVSTMREVAVAAGVSIKTVSRVFNEDPHVLPQTRLRVSDALSQLNYTPNAMSRAFRDGRSAVIGVAIPDIADPFFSAIAKAVEGVAAAYDMSVLVSSLGEDPANEREVVELMLRRQLSALVIAPTAVEHRYLERWLPKLPLVFVDRPPRGVAADCYVEDDFGGAHAATRHLVEHGHRSIAFAGGSARVSTTDNRLEGYRAALDEAGVVYREDLVAFGMTDAETTLRGITGVASAATPPTAVFSSDAKTTMLLVPVLAGRRWALTAFGDFPMASMLSPALTVVDQDPGALGRLAAERAVRRLQGEVEDGSPTVTTLPVRLLERESCGAPDPDSGLFPRSVPGGRGRVVWRSANLSSRSGSDLGPAASSFTT